MVDLRYKIIEEELRAAKKDLENAKKCLENATKVFEDVEKKILGGIRFAEDRNQTRAPRNLKLLFKNEISEEILTGQEIRGRDENPLEVNLVDESGNIVAVEPESSANVKIILLHKGESNGSDGDDWTVEETGGKNPFLEGNQLIKLDNGVGHLLNIKFRHHASEMNPSVFKLGARVVNTFHGVCIKESKTESFAVKNYRKKYTMKYKTPSLSDELFRLRNIRKNGKIEKRLQDHNIRNVKDFLIQLLIDPEELKKIVKLGEKRWKTTVESACSSDEKMSYYTDKHKTRCVVFDLSGQILGLYMDRQYNPFNMLPENQKADALKMLKDAFKNLYEVEPFKVENSVQHHLNGVGGHENTQIGEMNSPEISQRGQEDGSFFSTQDMEIDPNSFLRDSPIYSLNFEGTPFADFDGF